MLFDFGIQHILLIDLWARLSPERQDGYARLLRPGHSDSCVAHASFASCARVRTALLRSAAHAAQMTRPRLFHTVILFASSTPPPCNLRLVAEPSNPMPSQEYSSFIRP
jgi:hypothetical protein